MEIKKHLQGGTLRTVIVAEVQRCLQKYSGQSNAVEHAAAELGIAPRTLRGWRKNWKELQVNTDEFYNRINKL